MSGRPEEQAPPEIFYNESEAKKYKHNSRMIEIQASLAERALEMLVLPDHPCHLLDIGCGTGLSGEILSDAGHSWLGMDISVDMLGVAVEREVEGDLVAQDMGAGLPFRQGVFDGAISISAIQWLCNADKTEHNPRARLLTFFQSLYKVLRRGARAVLQFYPADAQQMQLITAAAMRSGFGGGLVVDYPHSTRAKKYFLVLLAGPPDPGFVMPQAMGEEGAAGASGAVQNANRQRERPQKKRGKERGDVKSKDWIMQKKEARRKQGKEVRADSKYTGRKRQTKSWS